MAVAESEALQAPSSSSAADPRNQVCKRLQILCCGDCSYDAADEDGGESEDDEVGNDDDRDNNTSLAAAGLLCRANAARLL